MTACTPAGQTPGASPAPPLRPGQAGLLERPITGKHNIHYGNFALLRLLRILKDREVAVPRHADIPKFRITVTAESIVLMHHIR